MCLAVGSVPCGHLAFLVACAPLLALLPRRARAARLPAREGASGPHRAGEQGLRQCQPSAPGRASVAVRHASPREDPACGKVSVLSRLGTFASDRRLEASHPFAAVGSEPGLCGAGDSRGPRQPHTKILLAGGPWGSVSTCAQGEGRILCASRAGSRQARQTLGPAPSSADTRLTGSGNKLPGPRQGPREPLHALPWVGGRAG